jgi:hypothetical protein
MPNPALGLAGASLASGAMSASAAKKAAKGNQAAADAATALQREQYENTTANYKPYLSGGNDAMAAYLYEMGLGPKPTFGGSTPAVERFYEKVPMGQGGPQDAGRMVVNGLMNNMMGIPQPKAGSGTSRAERFRVNGQTFSTLEEAEAFAKKNATGGTEYQGYSASPMAKYLMEEGVDSIEGSAAAAGGLYSGATLDALEGNRKQIIQADTADYFQKLFGLSNMGMAAAGNQAGAGSQYAGNVGNLQMGAANASGQARQQGAAAFGNTMADVAGIYGYFNDPRTAYSTPMNSSPRPMPNPFFGR